MQYRRRAEAACVSAGQQRRDRRTEQRGAASGDNVPMQLCRRMQRNQAILAELGVTNDKTIRGYVQQPQIDGL